MKPLVHAKSSAKKFGGQPSDYLSIHQLMDSSKSAHASNRHRVVFHSSFGIFILERVFGLTIVNSDGREVHVRDIGEQHCLEDFGGFIPDLSDYLQHMELAPWMSGAALRNPDLAPDGKPVRGTRRPAKSAKPSVPVDPLVD